MAHRAETLALKVIATRLANQTRIRPKKPTNLTVVAAYGVADVAAGPHDGQIRGEADNRDDSSET